MQSTTKVMEVNTSFNIDYFFLGLIVCGQTSEESHFKTAARNFNTHIVNKNMTFYK